MVKPLSEIETVRLSVVLGLGCGGVGRQMRRDAVVGDETLMSPSAAAKVVVASMNMMTLVTMSR